MEMKRLDKDNIEDILALTPMQEGMLFHYLKEPESSYYFEQLSLEISGEIDPGIFEKSWNFVIEINEMLRTVFRWEKVEHPIQIILAGHTLQPRYFDFSDSDIDEIQKRLEEVKVKDRAERFDLQEVPFRVTLCKIGEDKHEMIIGNHHILYDGWSNGIILKEFFRAYHTLCKGERLIRPPVKTPFKEFIKWIQSQDRNIQEKFWGEYLDGIDTPTALPIKRRSSEVKSAESVSLILVKDIKDKLDVFVNDNRVTLASVFYTAWGILLQKYCGCDDVIFGTTVSGRSTGVKGIEDMVGLFINTIPLRVQSTPGVKIIDVLTGIETLLLERKEFENTPLVDIGSYSSVAGSESLFDTMVAIENYPLDNRLVPGDRLLSVHSYSMAEMTHYDLTVGIMLFNEIEIRFSFKRELFDKETVENLASHFKGIVRNIIENPETVLSQLEIISIEEKNRILYDFNNTAAEYPAGKTIHELFEEQVERTPNHVALVGPKLQNTKYKLQTNSKPQITNSKQRGTLRADFLDAFGEIQLSYGLLNEESNRLAYTLIEKGVQPDTIVGIMVERSVEMIIGILSILKSGGAYLPIDPEYPQERIDFMMKDSWAKLLATTGNLAKEDEKVRRWEGEINYIEELLRAYDPLSFSTSSSASSAVKNLLPATGNLPPAISLAYIIYTSGSTGRPKGVLIKHGAVVNRLNWMQQMYPLGSHDIILQKTPFTFDVSVWELFWWSFYGARLCLLYPGEEKDPAAIIKAIDRNYVTTMHFVPSMLNAFLAYIESSRESYRCVGLRQVFASGEVLGASHVEQFHRLLKVNEDCRLRLVNLYGPTEATVDVSYYNCSADHRFDKVTVPIGKPINNIRLYIVNIDLGLQPIGIAGELCIAGVGLARGYLNRPELTSERFIYFAHHSPLTIHHSPITNQYLPEGHLLLRAKSQEPRAKFYKTGDLACWLSDGNIEFLGRIDHQVKIRGSRIELGEIENRLLNHHEIKEAVVLVQEEEKGDKYICAYVVCRSKPSVSELREYLGKKLPDYMIPSYFVKLEKIPLNANGKIDRKALPGLRGNSLNDDIECIPPQNEVEKILVEIWKKVLGREEVGINQNFFAIGGDSIKSIQIISRMSSAGYKVEMNDLFQYPIISKLAPHVKKLKRIPEQSVITGTIPLTPIQKAFYNESHNDPHHYNQAIMLYSKNQLDKEIVKKVFTKIQEHHDALRMTYKINRENGEVVQIDHDLDYPLSLEEYDLRKRENCFEELQTKANGIQASLNLEKGPLMNLGLFHLDDGDRLLIVIHHLIIDGVSWRILFEDIETLYGQYKQGLKFALPSKSDSFKLWSEKMSGYANSKPFLKEKNYWAELESNIVSRIKKDFEVEDNYVKDAQILSLHLGEEETSRLLTKVNEAFKTEINDILLMALGLGIKKTFGQDRVLVALEGHGREEILENIDISGTVGWFTSVHPVLMGISYADDLGHQVKEIKETLRRIPNKGIGYGILKYLTSEEYKKEIQFKLKPQISFNYLGQFDEDVKQLLSFEMAKESAGNKESLKNQREYEIDVYGMVAGNRLTMNFSYNKKHFKWETIASLVSNFESELRQIIAFCCSKERIEFTPSDFTYKVLPIETIDWLLREYPAIEDIYTLTPMQEGMLFHALVDEASSAYFEQMSFRLQEKLDICLVEKSLDELFKRHDILRTAFVYKDIERPVQVILKERTIEFYYEDVSKIGGREGKENFIKKFKVKDKGRLFDLSKDVLMRVSILRVDESEYEFTWSFHHILIDGWSSRILISEFFEIYNSYLECRPYKLPEIKQYQVYIDWLEKRDINLSKSYWKKYLEDYQEMVSVPKTITNSSNEIEYQLVDVYFKLKKEKTIALDYLEKSYHVTLNTIIQTIWGIILGKYKYGDKDETDVVFGAVVSGRPPEIEGIESMVGLFINTIPVRIKYKHDVKFNELLQEVQERALDSEPYHYYPLAEIQADSILKRKLLDNILVFENYPGLKQLDGVAKNDGNTNKPIKLEISNIKKIEQTNYDFNLIIITGDQPVINFKYNGNRYETDLIKQLELNFKSVIDQVVDNPGITISDIKIVKNHYALTPLQRSLYQRIQEDFPVKDRNLCTFVLLEGELDRQKVENIFDKLLERHESLRTGFGLIGDEVIQVIHPRARVEFKVGYHEAETGETLTIIDEVISPFNFTEPPLIRTALVKIDDAKHVLIMKTHLLVTDAVSHDILIHEFISLYAGQEISTLKVQYKDYLEMQSQQRQKIKQQEDYWLKELAGDLPRLNLPVDYPGTMPQQVRTNTLSTLDTLNRTRFEMGNQQQKILKKLAVEEDVSLEILFLTIYYIMLSKVTRQEDIIIGYLSTGRRCNEWEKIVGPLANPLILRNYPIKTKAFVEFLKEVKEKTIAAFNHRDYPWGDLLEKLTPNTVFDVMFDYRNEIQGVNLPKEMKEFKKTATKFPTFVLKLQVFEREGKNFFEFEYNPKRLSEEKVERFIDYFEEIVTCVAESKDIELKNISVSHDLWDSQVEYELEEYNHFNFIDEGGKSEKNQCA
jgi:iturin family lipopeptide synthetase B